jgi:glycosyltransferase involved in cell wall biosynthesis
LRRAAREAPVDVVLLSGSESLVYGAALRLWAWEIGARLVAEETEEPFVYDRPGGWVEFKKAVYNSITLKLFDAFVVISTHLESRIRPLLRRRAPMLRLPVMVDTALFGAAAAASPRKPGTVAYCADLRRVDEVGSLLKIWSLVTRDLPSARLRIIGGEPNPQAAAELREIAASLGVKASVEFVGAVARAELPAALAESDAMVLPRASGLFSRAGMPIKLGEYLATGRPVVVTETGDIGRYLQDRVSAYLVPPGDEKAFAAALKQVLTHRQQADEVGRRGQAVAREHLDMTRNCARFIEFASGLRRNGSAPRCAEG